MADPEFATTRWSQVLAARGPSSDARQALSDLCAAYYSPVVVYLTRRNASADLARDLAHEFFARLLSHPGIQGADPARGRFRNYLLGAVKHFVANRQLRESRWKRGGGRSPESLDSPTTEAGEAHPMSKPAFPATAPPADTSFDRAWALAVVERSLAALEDEARRAGSLAQFTALKPWLTPHGPLAAESAMSVSGLSDGARKTAVHRLRRRFRQRVRAEIAQTLPAGAKDAAAVDDEMRYLIEALARPI